MLKAIKSIEHKKALKKALKELENNHHVNKRSTDSNSNVSKVYSRDTSRVNSAFTKPSTEVIDLKEFKNWRKVEKVESNNPVYHDQLFKSSLSKNDDQFFDDVVQKPINVSSFVGNQTNEERTPSTDFSKYFSEKRKINVEKESSQKVKNDDEKFESAKSTFAKMFEEVEKIKQLAKQNRQEKVEDEVRETDKTQADVDETELVLQKSETIEEKLPEVKVEIDEAKPKLKVLPKESEHEKILKAEPKHVSVDISKPVSSTTVKRQTNRKPRGKNKRKFDADVVGSVDWR